MSCLGVHLALSDSEARALLSKHADKDRVNFIHEIEPRYFEEPQTYLAETDKSWDAMHRLLGDGRLTYDGGDYPLNHVVLGGQKLHEHDDYLISLKTPEQVRHVASALANIDEVEFRRRYDALDPGQYDGEIGDDDFAYTWDWFQGVRALFQVAASEGRYVLFSVDQ